MGEAWRMDSSHIKESFVSNASRACVWWWVRHQHSNYDHRLCQQPDLNLKPSIPLNWLCSLGKLPYCISNTSFCKMDTEHLYKMGLRIYHKVYITLNGLEYSWLNGHESEQTPGDSRGQRSQECCSPWGH